MKRFWTAKLAPGLKIENTQKKKRSDGFTGSTNYGCGEKDRQNVKISFF